MSKSVFIIAELSANHGNDINIAKETIKAAKRAGANAIKIQTYTADTITLDSHKDHFKITQGTYWDGQYLYDLYKSASLPWEWHKELFDIAAKEGLICFSSPFDPSAVDLLEKLDCPIYKIASLEITDIPLIKYIAQKGKPIIISTGVADIADIELALKTCIDEGNNRLTILKCTTAYPAAPEDADLLTIPDMEKRFGVNVGLSDHTLGIEAPVVAVSLGAQVIEKHFILDKSVGGADAHFSLDENEFREMVKSVRKAELMLGKVNYQMSEKNIRNKEFSRSLFIVEDVKCGDEISSLNVRSIRPNFGLHPKHWLEIKGKAFTMNFEKGTPLSSEMFS
jgi:pseudaminic acid synthase